MIERGYEGPSKIEDGRPDAYRDPVRQIRLEIDPLVAPSEMTRASRLLAFGPGVPEQYTFLNEGSQPLEFAIKRHRATRLHTDIRLQAFGHLISWASYERPSLNPRKWIDLREMPDHDPRYLRSERRIPDGSYGAGPMLVWDYGTYRPIVSQGVSDEQAVVVGLQQGGLDLWFEGKRINGGFRMEKRLRGWRLRKLADEHARIEPDEWDDRSVLSGRSLDHIEREYQDSLRRLREKRGARLIAFGS